MELKINYPISTPASRTNERQRCPLSGPFPLTATARSRYGDTDACIAGDGSVHLAHPIFPPGKRDGQNFSFQPHRWAIWATD